MAALAVAAAAGPAAIGDFGQRVEHYLQLRSEAARGLPALKPRSSAAAIATHQRELADRIRRARPAAGQGDVFTPAIASEFRRRIALTMQGPERQRILHTLAQTGPVHGPLAANAPYPAAQPFQSVPPTLLLNLPKLPPALRYAVVGRNLLLLDTDARLVVDEMEAAIP